MTVGARICGAALVALLASGAAADACMTPQPGVFYHGDLNAIAFGGHGELRFADDRVRGVSDPEWFSFGRVSGFALARIHARIRLAAQAAWDRGADDFVLEHAEVAVRLRRTMEAHAGIFLTPLGRSNLEHDATRNEFDEQSLVATQLVGVPNAQLGAGIRGIGRVGKGWPLAYQIDVVTGYDDGLVMDSPGGTRVPRGRNNYGDNNGVPALAGRLSVSPSCSTEIGLAAQSGRYNETEIGGVRVDDPRYVHIVLADAASRVAGFRVSGEAAIASIDVSPGLGTLFAERQWGASIELARTLRAPVVRGWKGSSLGAALRVDAVDFDRAILGDSRSRISASLNLRPRAFAMTRFGWYYEIRRDRFNNNTPMAGLVLSAASCF